MELFALIAPVAIAVVVLCAGTRHPIGVRPTRRWEQLHPTRADVPTAERHPLDILPPPRPAQHRARRAALSYLPVRAAVRVAAVAAPLASWRRAARRELGIWQVGCAAVSLVLHDRTISDASVGDLMELAGTDLDTTFAALDRLATRIRPQPPVNRAAFTGWRRPYAVPESD